MYRILIIETGEYLYEVSPHTSLLTKYELEYFEYSIYKLYETDDKTTAKCRLNSSASDYNVSPTLCINYLQTPNSFEVVEV